MNLIFRCEQCGVQKPCILVMVGADKTDYMQEPRTCINGGSAKWKLLR